MFPVLPQCVASMTKAGTLFNTYTTAKSILNSDELVTYPPGSLTLGSKIQIKAWGGLSNIVTTPGTVTFQIMMGTIAAWSSGAIQLNATAHTLLPWWLDVSLRVDSTGTTTSAKLIGGGVLNGIMFTNTAAQTDAVNTTGAFPVPATAPAVGTGFDNSISNILDLWVGFSISNAGNGVQLYDYTATQYRF